jgi:hypothetical protein
VGVQEHIGAGGSAEEIVREQKKVYPPTKR